MSIKFVSGDIWLAGLPALGHGCNCIGVMGAGIAKEFKQRYPDMFIEYRRRCSVNSFRLGDCMVWEEEGVTIFNLGTQKAPKVTAELPAIKKSVQKAINVCENAGIDKLGLPRIGAGLGGLKWEDVKSVLQECGDNSCVELIVFENFIPGK